MSTASHRCTPRWRPKAESLGILTRFEDGRTVEENDGWRADALSRQSKRGQYFHIDAITGGFAGCYSVIVQLPSDTGADTFQFEVDRS